MTRRRSGGRMAGGRMAGGGIGRAARLIASGLVRTGRGIGDEAQPGPGQSINRLARLAGIGRLGREWRRI